MVDFTKKGDDIIFSFNLNICVNNNLQKGGLNKQQAKQAYTWYGRGTGGGVEASVVEVRPLPKAPEKYL